jgi:hypothetical protein
MKRRSLCHWGAALVFLCLQAAAHDGPPFPILENAPVGPYRVALWTDPDIGMGVVFVLLENPPGQALPQDARVRLGVQPVSGRLPEAFYQLKGKPERKWMRYDGEVPFDSGDVFRLRVIVESPRGGGDAAAEVEATPDGMLGPISLVLYLLPFLGVAVLWTLAVLKRREAPVSPRS